VRVLRTGQRDQREVSLDARMGWQAEQPRDTLYQSQRLCSHSAMLCRLTFFALACRPYNSEATLAIWLLTVINRCNRLLLLTSTVVASASSHTHKISDKGHVLGV
jgi:hypothetical protein